MESGVPDFSAELRSSFDQSTKKLTIPKAWEGFPGTGFGGFVAASSLVAASTEAAHPRPLSFFTRFHRPVPSERPVDVEIEHEHTGRLVDALTVRLVADGKLLCSMSALFGVHGQAPLDKQAIRPMPPLRKPAPVHQFLEEAGIEPPPLMRRIGYRGESEAPPEGHDMGDWQMHVEWPDPDTDDLVIRAAYTLLAIDNGVGPTAMVANQFDLNEEWPVGMPSLDLTGWFYRPEARAPATADGTWLRTRCSVPVSWSGFATGRSQVWAGDLLIAEGMSQVALLPPPPRG